jgi:plastocyanin
MNATVARRLGALALAASLAGVLSACGNDNNDKNAATNTTGAGGSATTSASATTGAASAGDFTIQNFKLPAVTGKAGSSVTIKNADAQPHTLTAVDGSFDTGVLQKDQSTSITLPSKPGTYPIKCKIHAPMTGTATVT